MNEQIKYHLRNLATLRAFAPIFSDNLFFIFGCQRSGTTLLLSILNAHPQIHIIDETEFPSPYPFPSTPRLMLAKLKKQYLCLKMLEHSNKLEFLKRFYPKAKIIWPVRNPYSAIASMLNLVNSNSKTNWIERCAKTEIERLKPFYPEALGQYDLDQLSTIELGAIYWSYKNSYPKFMEDSGFSVFKFTYETLLTNQQETLQDIVDFLGIEWDDNLLNFHQVNPSKSLAGGTKTDRPIDPTKTNSLKGLSEQDIDTINQICYSVMQNYNYPILEKLSNNFDKI
jgi:hypothetical protein